VAAAALRPYRLRRAASARRAAAAAPAPTPSPRTTAPRMPHTGAGARGRLFRSNRTTRTRTSPRSSRCCARGAQAPREWRTQRSSRPTPAGSPTSRAATPHPPPLRTSVAGRARRAPRAGRSRHRRRSTRATRGTPGGARCGPPCRPGGQ
jgi:hypothetical protein